MQAITKALLRCEDARAAGLIAASTDCPNDPATASAILTGRQKLKDKVARRCGGDDRTCGTPDDDALASIGWGSLATCPGFESGSCNNPIADCGDIGVCRACVDEAAVEQAAALYYDHLATAQFGTGSALNLCQRAIGRETGRFLRTKSKALQKCWDARLKGKHANACPVPGDGKAAARIQQAEDRKVANICRACGGADGCGDGGDFSPTDIGFAASCPTSRCPAGPPAARRSPSCRTSSTASTA